MLIPILHRKRKAAEAAAKAIKEVGGTIEQTRRVYGTRLLVRGLLWASVYLLSRDCSSLRSPDSRARCHCAAAHAILCLLPLDLDERRERDGRARAPHRARSARLRVSRVARLPGDARPLDVAIDAEPRRLQPAPHLVDAADALLRRPVRAQRRYQ